jgi:uncharacterized coiled-coil DUF342 family protein
MSVKAAEAEVSATDFVSLEEKVYRTIELLKAARDARATAERDTQRVREQLEEREEENDRLRKEVVSLRKEREEVKARVEKMMDQIDTMISAESK